MITHYLNLYQKPKAGNRFIRRYRVYNYKHKISALGGFDTALCDVAIPLNQAELFLDQYLGNRIAIYVDNPAAAIWEGFINRITFSVGNCQHTISLDEMVNRAAVIYTLTGATNPTSSSIVNNTDSQAIYGIKAEKVDLGFQYSAGSAVTTAAANTIIAQQAWPKASSVPGSSGGLVTLEMLGFYHTLKWEAFTSASTTTPTLTTIITADILPIDNTGVFFDDTDTSALAANAQTINRNRVRGQTAWDVLQQLAEIGDAANKWVVGISPTDPNTKTRRLYYRAFNSTIVYTAKRRAE
ncbi:MAG TPA: hypothetical protein VHO69_14930 [Phototrophicaceae bacterium]|nr:hypothetical protein [Phototrophicaceae bacterium]